MRPSFALLAIAVLTIVVSAVVYLNQDTLGMAGAVTLYLLVVLAGAYYLQVALALSLALCATLLINFLVVEPRYTFRIASVESWVALGGFLTVSLVVTSLVRRLQERTAEAEAADRQSKFARMLAERLAQETQPDIVLAAAAEMLQDYLEAPVCICWQAAGDLQCVPQTAAMPDRDAVNWTMQNAKTLGAGSSNWPDSPDVMLPFSRLPGQSPVLVCRLPRPDAERRQPELRSLCDQIALAYARASSAQQAQQAELNARAEAMQNALLASVSHDMRTPLTAIIGAVSALDSQDAMLDESSRAQLLQSIRGEAEHLCRAVENILSLARLDALGSRGLTLDWQSPEEIIGSTLARYRIRPRPCRLASAITSQALIRADAVLLSQALANLLDNAIAVHQGPDPILLSASQEDETLVIAVADRGPGFPADFQVADIQKFRSGSTQGFGLGLIIVSTIAALHDAQLVCRQRASGGAEVQLRFPVQRPGGDD